MVADAVVKDEQIVQGGWHQIYEGAADNHDNKERDELAKHVVLSPRGRVHIRREEQLIAVLKGVVHLWGREKKCSGDCWLSSACESFMLFTFKHDTW